MRRHANQGFTLVEVLVATIVLALIMLSTLTAMRTLARVEQRVVDTTERMDEMRAVNSRLRSLLEQAHGAAGGAGSGGTWAGQRRLMNSYFDGTGRQVTWMAALAGAGGVSGLHYLRLRRQGDRLLLDIVDSDPNETEPDWGRLVVTALLVDGVSRFDIAYRDGEEPLWQSSFESETGVLPEAIRVRVRVDERYWPDLVVAPSAHVAVN